MLFLTIIKTALKSLLANKLRSFLAMLGIIIGVASVIAMMSIGAGVQRDVMSKITSMGTNLLSVRPNQRNSGGVRNGTYQTLTLDDAKSVLLKVQSIDSVSPVVSGGAQIKYMDKNTRTSIWGAAETYPVIGSFEVENGRFFKESEVEKMARVAVLGSETADDLGFDASMIGDTIKIKGLNFQVVGILKEKGGSGMFNADDRAVVPYTTAMKILFGLDNINSIDMKAREGSDLHDAQDKITALLRKRHKIDEGDDDDFRVFNQEELIETASDFTRTFTFLLGGIAAISLLVGGIGIMNIMLVTVTERTREIGVRKAIGAKDRDILRQFLLESLIMSGIGGCIGVILGIIASRIIGMGPNYKTFVEPSSIILSLSVSIAVGVFFGYYPAFRAAMLDPIECLHYE